MITITEKKRRDTSGRLPRAEMELLGSLYRLHLIDRTLTLEVNPTKITVDECNVRPDEIGGNIEVRYSGRNAIYFAFLLRLEDKIACYGLLSNYGLQGRVMGFQEPEPVDMVQREAEAEIKLAEWEIPEYLD